tara:strand:- start:1371 stop:1562 length:192 start_codon:yes stop_codon:yes gene_type:complete
MENKRSNKKTNNPYEKEREPRIKSVHKSRKAMRGSSKENLKNVSKGNIDYDDYMEMEDWSDSR